MKTCINSKVTVAIWEKNCSSVFRNEWFPDLHGLLQLLDFLSCFAGSKNQRYLFAKDAL